jgi:hypothetical protein
MNEYIRSRIRADAARTIQLAADQSAIQHSGLRGRFRELLVDNLVAPWLPPYTQCGTGTIIDGDNRARKSTQEDIVIFDRSLMPSVLLSPSASEGVFPLNTVLARIEVKSVLTRAELRSALEAAAEIQPMKFAARASGTWGLPISLLFAFDSDLRPRDDPNAEWTRMMEVNRELDLLFSSNCPHLPGPIGGLCVVGRGCWVYGGADDSGAAGWVRAKMLSDNPHEEVLLFVGVLSNSCFDLHATRQGRDPKLASEGGIGNYVLSVDTYEPVR